MKTRLRYSEKFRRKALIEVSRGKTMEEALLKSGFDLSEVMKNDKKYASKLFHKWKKEMLNDISILYFDKRYECNDDIKSELETMGEPYEPDFLVIEAEKRTKNNG